MKGLLGVILIASVLSVAANGKKLQKIDDEISGEDTQIMERTLKGYKGFWKGFTGGYFDNRDYELNKHCLGPKT